MASENQVVFELVLDDGSVKKAFATVKNEGEKTAKSFGDNLSDALTNIKSPTDVLASLALIKISLDKIKQAAEAAFDFARQGEAVKQVSANFDFLAARAGIVGVELKAGLDQAANGLSDTTDLLELANRAFITLGSSASKLPDILRIAERRTATLGGTLTENFEGLTRAIEGSNRRALLQFGLIVDLEKAQKDYAKQLGLTTSELSVQEKQQATLNAVLAEGEKQFGGTTGEVKQISNSFDRLANSGKDLADTLAVGFSNLVQPVLVPLFNVLKDITVSFNRFLVSSFDIGSASEVAAAQVESLKNEIASLQATVSQRQNLNNIDDIVNAQIRLKNATEELGRAQQVYNGLTAKAYDVRDLRAKLDAQANEIIDWQNRQLEYRKQAVEKFKAELVKIETDTQSAVFQGRLVGASLEEQKRIESERAEFEHQQRLKALKDQFLVENGISQTQYNQLVEAENARSKAVIETIEINSAKKIAEAKAKQRQQELQATSTALGQIATLQINATGELAQVGKAAALTKATIDGYLAVQSAYKDVPYPFNFAAAALVGAAAAANIQKIASTGDGGGSAAFNPSTSGGGVISPTSPEAVSPIAQEQVREPTTGIVVNIQGDVLGDDSAGSRIVDLINSAFDQKGVVVRQGAFA